MLPVLFILFCLRKSSGLLAWAKSLESCNTVVEIFAHARFKLRNRSALWNIATKGEKYVENVN